MAQQDVLPRALAVQCGELRETASSPRASRTIPARVHMTRRNACPDFRIELQRFLVRANIGPNGHGAGLLAAASR